MTITLGRDDDDAAEECKVEVAARIVQGDAPSDAGKVSMTCEDAEGKKVIIEGEDRGAVQEAVEEFKSSMAREKARRERWGCVDGSFGPKAMTELANLFPTMRGIMGTDPWDPEKLIAWLNSGAPTSGSKWAALFLLGVWNPHTDWRQYGLKWKKSGPPGKFDLFSAMASWDYKHVEAMREWIANPFWP